jgi:hypothetical protein
MVADATNKAKTKAQQRQIEPEAFTRMLPGATTPHGRHFRSIAAEARGIRLLVATEGKV